MKQYLDLVERVLNQGTLKPNRTGTDTIYKFAEHMKFNLRGQLPIVTTKHVPWKLVLLELMWYLRGEDHIRWLRDEKDVHIWDEWANDETGYLGPAYSVIWRKFPKIKSYKKFKDAREQANEYYDRGLDMNDHDDFSWDAEVEEYDQIANVLDKLKNNPESRRIVLSTWYPGLEDQMGLPPCHLLTVFNCKPLGLEKRMNLAVKTSDEASKFVADLQGGRLPQLPEGNIHDELDELNVPAYELNAHLTQRSADIALGVPFNITCYSALTKILAHLCNMVPGTFSHLLVDAHIYVNHVDGLNEQLSRSTRPLPNLMISDELTDIDDLKLEHLDLVNYNPHDKIKFEVAV